MAFFAYRTLGVMEFFSVVRDTVKTTAVVTIVLCGAFIFNYVVTVERIPQMVFAVFTQFDLSPALFLLLLNILYLVLGCFLDVSTIMLVVTPSSSRRRRRWVSTSSISAWCWSST